MSLWGLSSHTEDTYEKRKKQQKQMTKRTSYGTSIMDARLIQTSPAPPPLPPLSHRHPNLIFITWALTAAHYVTHKPWSHDHKCLFTARIFISHSTSLIDISARLWASFIFHANKHLIYHTSGTVARLIQVLLYHHSSSLPFPLNWFLLFFPISSITFPISNRLSDIKALEYVSHSNQ